MSHLVHRMSHVYKHKLMQDLAFVFNVLSNVKIANESFSVYIDPQKRLY